MEAEENGAAEGTIAEESQEEHQKTWMKSQKRPNFGTATQCTFSQPQSRLVNLKTSSQEIANLNLSHDIANLNLKSGRRQLNPAKTSPT